MAGPNLPTRLGAATLALPYGAVKAARMAWSSGWSYFGRSTSGGGSLAWPSYVDGTAFDYTAAAGDLRDNSVAASCVACIQRSIHEPPIQVLRRQGDQEEPVPDHSLVKFLRRPNKYISLSRMLEATIADLPTGKAYWLLERTRRGDVATAFPVCADEIRPEWPRGGSKTFTFIEKYVRNLGGEEEEWLPENVIHFRFGAPDRANVRLARHPSATGKREVASLNEGANYRGSILRNMGVPGHMLTTTDKDVEVTEGFVKRIREMWKALTTGDNRGGLIVPTFPAKLERAGFSPQELDVATMLQWDIDIVCALFGVPAMLIDLPSGKEHRSYANKEEARKFFTQQTLVPLWKGIAEDLTLQMLPLFSDDDDERVAFDLREVEALQEDANEKYERVHKAVGKPFLTVDEGRADLGFEAMTPEQKQELQPPEPEPVESFGDRSVTRSPARMNGNGKAAAVKAVATVEQDGVAYRYSAEAPGEVAAQEFEGLESFWTQRRQRWAGETEGEEDEQA